MGHETRLRTKKPKERKVGKAAERASRQRPEFWLWAIGLAIALFAAFQVYAPALQGPFLFDDSYLPMNVPAWANATFFQSMRGVRPLLMASYWINQHSSGNDTTTYHAWNLL